MRACALVRKRVLARLRMSEGLGVHVRTCACVRALVLCVQMRERAGLCVCVRAYANECACVRTPTQPSMSVCALLCE